MTRIHTQDTAFEIQPGETLLEALERTGHEVEYQCRSGYCGACRLKLQSGQVSYAETPLAFIGPDEILPCCCRAEGDLVLNVGLRADVLEHTRDLFVPELFD